MTRYVSFVGAPGSSKTTQIRMIQAALPSGALVVASVPRLIRREPDLTAGLTPPMTQALEALTAAAMACRDRGELAPLEIDRFLFRIVEQLRSPAVVALDACPRGVAQALVFLSRPKLAARTNLFHLRLPGDEIEWSHRRQFERAVATKGVDYARASRDVFERKTRVYMENTKRAIALLRAMQIRVTELDARERPAEIHRQVMRHLALTPSGVPVAAYA